MFTFFKVLNINFVQIKVVISYLVTVSFLKVTQQNILSYFIETKNKKVKRILSMLQTGDYIFLSQFYHSELSLSLVLYVNIHKTFQQKYTSLKKAALKFLICSI